MTNMANDWPSNPNGYKLISSIGEGNLGPVWKAKVIEGKHIGEFVAVKKINLEKCGDNKLEDIRKNMLLTNLLEHPNILDCKITFISKQDLWLVFEIMEAGSVENIIKAKYSNGIKDQALIATILKETLQGLRYLHQNNQIHRDIKAGNILVKADGSIKISDFGVAAQLKGRKKRSTFIGSPCWMAPEVLDKKNGYDFKADIWSLGITAIELAEGKPPNSDLSTMKLLLKTLNDEPPRLTREACWDEHFHHFISCCLVKDPSQRKSAEDILKDCRNFFGKAKGKEYIKEKLLKGVKLIQLQDNDDTEAISTSLFENGPFRKSHCIEFNFEAIGEGESSCKDSQSLILSTQENKHLIKKVHSNPNLVLVEENEKNPAHASREKQPTPRLLHMQISDQPVLSSGDKDSDFNFLNEEEI